MITDHRGQYLSKTRYYLSGVVTPIEYIVDSPTRLFDWAYESLTTKKELQVNNTNLRVQLILLQAQLQKLIALEKENTQLRAMLQATPRMNGRVLVAQIISVDSDPFTHEVVINQGIKSGIYVGQPVLDATGVLGQVIAVGPYTSRILLLTDSRSAIPIQDTRNGIRGVVVGTGNQYYLALANIPMTTNILPGDMLVTSGLDGHFPSGYPVGVVREIIHNPGYEFSIIPVAPSAQINRSQLVLLLWSNNLSTTTDNSLLNTSSVINNQSANKNTQNSP